jgi:hypothetical protein
MTDLFRWAIAISGFRRQTMIEAGIVRPILVRYVPRPLRTTETGTPSIAALWRCLEASDYFSTGDARVAEPAAFGDHHRQLRRLLSDYADMLLRAGRDAAMAGLLFMVETANRAEMLAGDQDAGSCAGDAFTPLRALLAEIGGRPSGLEEFEAALFYSYDLAAAFARSQPALGPVDRF